MKHVLSLRIFSTFYATRIWVLMISLALGFGHLLAQSDLQAELSKRGEVRVRLARTGIDLVELSSNFSIDRVTSDSIWLYLNQSQFESFNALQLPYQFIPFTPLSPSLHKLQTATALKYYTYSAYVAAMQQFQTTYPQWCKVIETGTSVNGRKLLYLKLTDNPDEVEPEPELMYTATIHGNETLGFALMMQLADSLLRNASQNGSLKNLLSGAVVWIAPLTNPDGFYAAGDGNYTAPTRFNANGADINRNFPDFVLGAHPDDKIYQPETQSVMTFMQSHYIALGANFHGGAEVVNYPHDCLPELHPDDMWYNQISNIYAQKAIANGPSGYFKGISSSGSILGYEWYPLFGGRQDYLNLYCFSREVTIELSNTKVIPEADLPNYWNYNKQALLDFLHQGLYGFRGQVLHPETGQPAEALVELIGHDNSRSIFKSRASDGWFFRPVAPGTYTVRLTIPGVVSWTFNNVSIAAGEQKLLELGKGIRSELKTPHKTATIYPNPASSYLYIQEVNHTEKWQIIDPSGRTVLTGQFTGNNAPINIKMLPNGMYWLRIFTTPNLPAIPFTVIHN